MQVKLLKMLYNGGWGGGGGWPPSPQKNDPTIMKLAIVQTLNQSTNLHSLKTLTVLHIVLYI
jgi:hypothetical protein